MIRRLAVGGMGEIFLAQQEIAGVSRVVVLKRLLPDLAEDPRLLAMFIDEARIAANLSHPGIVQVHEFGQDAQGHFIVMEYVPGHHLGQLIRRAQREGRTIPTRVAAFIVHELAHAVDHAHNATDANGTRLDIVHRDISPSNVLVSFRGDVKLMDFGVARAANRAHRTNDGTVRGKFAYMAPEQIEGGEVDARSDVFAIGVVLWELTLGRRLFDGKSDVETIRASLEQPIPRPSSIDPSYPPGVEDVVMAALERARDRRISSAAELAAGLKAYLRVDPADRDDVAAQMSLLFPDDVAESQKLEEMTRKRVVEKLTVPLSPRPTPSYSPTSPEIEITPSPRRVRWLAPTLVMVVVGGGATTWWATRAPGDRPTPDGRLEVAVADAALLVPDVVLVLDASDVAIEASVIVQADAKPRPDARPAPDAAPHAPDAAVVAMPDASPAVLELGAFSFITHDEGALSITGDGCTTRYFASGTARCKGLPVGSTHVFTFQAGAAPAFSASLKVAAGVTKCEVIPSTGTVRC